MRSSKRISNCGQAISAPPAEHRKDAIELGTGDLSAYRALSVIDELTGRRDEASNSNRSMQRTASCLTS